MKTLSLVNPAVINPTTPGSEKEPTNIQRRTVIGGALLALLASPGRVMANHEKAVPKDPIVLLLNGLYHPVVFGSGPDLGLSRAGVNLNDGSYMTTKIYPVHVEGIPCNANEDTAIGNFYVEFGDPGLAAYQLPGGAIAMQFIPNCGGFRQDVRDGLGGAYMNGTFELKILEATGIYRSFEGGHNHMVDRLHRLANKTFDEYCFCFISRR
jgi:hypothetical protein